MKLLVVTPWPLAMPGGGQRLARDLARSLAVDHRVEVIVAAGSGLTSHAMPPVTDLPIHEVRVPLVCAPLADPHRAAYLAGLDVLADDIRPDAILYTPHYSSCAVQAEALAVRRRIPFMIVPAVHLDHPAHTSRAARWFYRSADANFCLSDIEREWLVRAGVSPERAVTIGFGATAASARPARDGLVGRPLRLLTVGAYVPHKQLDHQVDALSRLRNAFQIDARLTVAGPLTDVSVLDRLRRLVGRRSVENSVEFLTDCSEDDLVRLHHESDYFLFTSRSESFGAALFEAIGFGTQPIVYPHPVYRGLVESSGFGVIARRASPRALAAAVLGARSGAGARQDDERLRWMRERSWNRATAPIAEALRRIA